VRSATVLGVSTGDLAADTDLTTTYLLDSLEVMEIGARRREGARSPGELDDIASVRSLGEVVDNLTRRTTARMTSERRRVVITGLGVKTLRGCTPESAFTALLAAKSAAQLVHVDATAGTPFLA